MDFNLHVLFECMYVHAAAKGRPVCVRETWRGRAAEATRQSIPYT